MRAATATGQLAPAAHIGHAPSPIANAPRLRYTARQFVADTLGGAAEGGTFPIMGAAFSFRRHQ